MREMNDTSIFFCDTVGCLKPCLIMMETGPGCFERDIREDEMSHSNLALGRVPCSKSLSGTFWSWFSTLLVYGLLRTTYSLFTDRWCKIGKHLGESQAVNRLQRNVQKQGAQDFYHSAKKQNDVYKLLSWHYSMISCVILLWSHCVICHSLPC